VRNLSRLVIALRPEVQPGACPAAEVVREGKGSRSEGRIPRNAPWLWWRRRKRIGQRLPVTGPEPCNFDRPRWSLAAAIQTFPRRGCVRPTAAR